MPQLTFRGGCLNGVSFNSEVVLDRVTIEWIDPPPVHKADKSGVMPITNPSAPHEQSYKRANVQTPIKQEPVQYEIDMDKNPTLRHSN